MAVLSWRRGARRRRGGGRGGGAGGPGPNLHRPNGLQRPRAPQMRRPMCCQRLRRLRADERGRENTNFSGRSRPVERLADVICWRAGESRSPRRLLVHRRPPGNGRLAKVLELILQSPARR